MVRYWPVELLLRRALRRGPVLCGRLGRDRYAYLIGPEANALVFAHDEWFSFAEAMAALVPVDGPTSVVVSDGDDHARRRGALRPSLAPRSVDGYLAVMTRSADEAVASLRPGEAVDAYALFRAAIRRSTLRALFGDAMAADADALGEALQPLLDLVDQLPQLVAVQRRLRLGRWRRAMRARAEVDAYVHARIAEARRGEAVAGSTLELLVNGRDGEGSGLREDEIRDQVVTLIAAGYETTSAAMGWAAYLLATHPQWQERARTEVREVVGDRVPTPAEVKALPVVGAIVAETLRLYPPAAVSARHVVTPFEFAGARIEPGTTVLYSPYATHRDPRVWDAPEEFRPERWLADERPAPEAYLPFGGGGHRCLGSGLATVELTVMVARLVARGSFRLAGPRPKARSMTAMRPHGGVAIALDE